MDFGDFHLPIHHIGGTHLRYGALEINNTRVMYWYWYWFCDLMDTFEWMNV